MKVSKNHPIWAIALVILCAIILISILHLWNWVILFGIIFLIVYSWKKGWIKKILDEIKNKNSSNS